MNEASFASKLFGIGRSRCMFCGMLLSETERLAVGVHVDRAICQRTADVRGEHPGDLMLAPESCGVALVRYDDGYDSIYDAECRLAMQRALNDQRMFMSYRVCKTVAVTYCDAQYKLATKLTNALGSMISDRAALQLHKDLSRVPYYEIRDFLVNEFDADPDLAIRVALEVAHPFAWWMQ